MKKIDIYAREHKSTPWYYLRTTTTKWAKTCREAKNRALNAYPQFLTENIKANFQK
jgi:hypothetical protein